MGRDIVWRRCGIVCIALAMVAAVCLSASATQPVGATVRSLCSKPGFRLQFWPNGTPGNPRPHLIVYPGAHGRTRQQDRIGYATLAELSGPAVCGRQTDFAPRVQQMRRKVRTSAPVQLVCRPGRVRSFSVPTSTPSAGTPYSGMVQVRGADRRVLYAIFSPTHLSPDGRPVLQYDSRVCTGRRIRCTNVDPPCRLSSD